MKHTAKINIDISVEYSDPDSAYEYFCSELPIEEMRCHFGTLEDVTWMIIVESMKFYGNPPDEMLIPEIGKFKRAELGGRVFHCGKSITLTMDGIDILNREMHNAAGNLVKEFDGVTYEQHEGGPDTSCYDCYAVYGNKLCLQLCGGDAFECRANAYWLEVIKDHDYDHDCEECRECPAFGTCTAQLVDSGKSTMPCPVVVMSRNDRTRNNDHKQDIKKSLGTPSTSSAADVSPGCATAGCTVSGHVCVCSKCGRKSWSVSEIHRVCNMTQPDGSRCSGTFHLIPEEAAHA